MGAWLIVVCTLLALAHRSTWNTCIKTLAIFFLALWFLAVTSLELFQVVCAKLIFLFYWLLCFFNHTLTLFVIIASVAGALRRTKFSRRETLTVHFEAFSFFTDAASPLFLWRSSGLSVLSFTLLLHVKRKL